MSVRNVICLNQLQFESWGKLLDFSMKNTMIGSGNWKHSVKMIFSNNH